MMALNPFIQIGFINFEAYHIYYISVALVDDITRNFEGKIKLFYNNIMTALSNSLQNQSYASDTFQYRLGQI